jgi:hypothetical protein
MRILRSTSCARWFLELFRGLALRKLRCGWQHDKPGEADTRTRPKIGRRGGRPRKPRVTEVEVKRLQELLHPHIDAAVERLVRLSQSEDPAIALRACNSILDRYFERACEAQTFEDVDRTAEDELRREVDRMSQEELVEYLAGSSPD